MLFLAREVSMEELAEIRKERMLRLKPSSTEQCVFPTQDAVHFLTT